MNETSKLKINSLPVGAMLCYRYSDNYLVPFMGLSLSDWLFLNYLPEMSLCRA